MSDFVLPTQPLYTNDAGMPIFWIDGANVAPRPTGMRPRFLVIHHTAGSDSRKYLWKNPRGVSTHYLLGIYADAGPAPRTYKFASESSKQTFTQGYSSIGIIDNPNPMSISIEIEGPPLAHDVIGEAARLAGAIRRYWSEHGVDLLLIGHKHIDTQGKTDPQLNWDAFCEQVYSA